jgi:hypothetical protein
MVQWDNSEKTILRITFSGDWDWAYFRSACQQAVDMIATADHPVDVVFDLQASDKHVTRTEAVNQGRWIADLWPVNTGGNTVIVTDQPLMGAVLAVFRRLMPGRCRSTYIVETLGAAYALIAEKRGS